jgi:hypothetical protein
MMFTPWGPAALRFTTAALRNHRTEGSGLAGSSEACRSATPEPAREGPSDSRDHLERPPADGVCT